MDGHLQDNLVPLRARGARSPINSFGPELFAGYLLCVFFFGPESDFRLFNFTKSEGR